MPCARLSWQYRQQLWAPVNISYRIVSSHDSSSLDRLIVCVKWMKGRRWPVCKSCRMTGLPTAVCVSLSTIPELWPRGISAVGPSNYYRRRFLQQLRRPRAKWGRRRRIRVTNNSEKSEKMLARNSFAVMAAPVVSNHLLFAAQNSLLYSRLFTRLNFCNLAYTPWHLHLGDWFGTETIHNITARHSIT